uniref:Uncharacterized protein n=1 Tax=Aegilops tauschii subsp. strangulata TaxID=200361 RepID=A0A452Y9E1_AEGTS
MYSLFPSPAASSTDNNSTQQPVEGFEGLVDQNIVLEVIDVGHYMILPADYLAPDLIRCIATECGVDIDEASCPDHSYSCLFNTIACIFFDLNYLYLIGPSTRKQ